MSVDYGEMKEPARIKLLRIMSDLQWHDWRELVAVGGRCYGARLRELRRLGFSIDDIEPEEGKGKTYRLLSLEPGPPALKSVRVYFTPDDAVDILNRFGSALRPTAYAALEAAYKSYCANEDKL